MSFSAFPRDVRTNALFPPISLKIALAVALIAVFSLLLLEFAVLPRLAVSGRVDAEEWQKDMDRVNASYLLKNPGRCDVFHEDWVWRSAAYGAPLRAERSRRILVLGDSFVWGSGGIPNMNNLSWRQLERELRRRGYADVEVIAAGRSGATTRQEFNALPRILERYKPDLTVWLYVTNDADEGVVPQFDRAVLEKDRVYRSHLKAAEMRAFPRVNRQLAALREKKLGKTMPPEKVGYEYARWELEILKGENLRKYERTLAGLGAWLRENRVPLFFVTVPNWPSRESFSAKYAAVEPLFAKAGIPFHNILEEFAARYPNPGAEPERWRASPADGHPGHEATRFHARKIADILEAKHPSFLGRRGRPPAPAFWVNDWVPEDLEVLGRSGNHVELRYPASSARMPRMPVGSPFVQVSFRDPVPLERISVSGPAVAASRVFVSGEDPERLVQSGDVVGLGERSGPRADYGLADYPWKRCVDAIRVQAAFSGPDRTLRIEFR